MEDQQVLDLSLQRTLKKLMCFLLAEFHQLRSHKLLCWLEISSKLRPLCLLVMELMTALWFWEHMLVSVFSERKVNKLPELLTTPSDSSNSWSRYFSSMVEKHTEETLYYSFTASTRTSCTLSLSSTLVSTQHSQAKLFTRNSSTFSSTSLWPPYQSCSTLFLTDNTKSNKLRTTLITDKLCRNTSWKTLSYTKLDQIKSVFHTQFSFTGLYMVWFNPSCVTGSVWLSYHLLGSPARTEKRWDCGFVEMLPSDYQLWSLMWWFSWSSTYITGSHWWA